MPDQRVALGDLPATAYDPLPEAVRARRARLPRTYRSLVALVVFFNAGYVGVAEAVCVRPFGWTSRIAIVLHVALAVLLALFGASYARAVTSSPGHPDDRWSPPSSAGAPLPPLAEQEQQLITLTVPPDQPVGSQLRVDIGAETATTITLPDGCGGAPRSSLRVNARLLRAQADVRRAFSETAREYINFCASCEVFKPPRCHHCRKCNSCVVEMDHHCIWINNCVGRDNHKLFYLVVLYAFVSTAALESLYVARWVLFAMHAFGIDALSGVAGSGGGFGLEIVEIVGLALASAAALAHIASTGWLLVFHTFLIARGRTNVEHTCCKGQHPGCNYDRGVVANVQHVFGSAACAATWLLPLDPPACGSKGAVALALHAAPLHHPDDGDALEGAARYSE